MTGAIHGRPVAGVADPVPEMHLQPMELPDAERAIALEELNAALANRDPRKPALSPEVAQAVFTAYLRGWTDCRWHAARVRLAEVQRGMGEDTETLASVRIEVAGGAGQGR